jgi:alkaline phosphatase D
MHLNVAVDHDWGWNNGNKRLPRKHEFKNLFLDALGEAASSPRRNANNGVQVCILLDAMGAGVFSLMQ